MVPAAVGLRTTWGSGRGSRGGVRVWRGCGAAQPLDFGLELGVVGDRVLVDVDACDKDAGEWFSSWPVAGGRRALRRWPQPGTVVAGASFDVRGCARDDRVHVGSASVCRRAACGRRRAAGVDAPDRRAVRRKPKDLSRVDERRLRVRCRGCHHPASGRCHAGRPSGGTSAESMMAMLDRGPALILAGGRARAMIR